MQPHSLITNTLIINFSTTTRS